MNTIGSLKWIWVILALLLLSSLPAYAMSRAARKRPEFSPENYVPALIRALQDEDQTVRRDAARALGRIGPAAREALPALCCSTHDSVDYVRRTAQEAMYRIDPLLRREAVGTP